MTKSIKLGMSMQGILLMSYIVTALMGSQILSNCLSPILLVGAAWLIDREITIKNQKNIFWKSMKWMILVWAFGDSLWLVEYNFLNGNPENNLFYSYLYSIPNLILMSASLYYLYKKIAKWHFVQVFADFILLLLIFVLIVKFSLLPHLDFSDMRLGEIMTTGIYVVTDILILSVAGTLFFLSIKGRKVTENRVLLIGIALFPLADLLYSYMSYYHFYAPNNISDVLFMISLSMIGYASLIDEGEEETIHVSDDKESVKIRTRGIALIFLLPLISFIFGFADVMVLFKSVVLIGLHHFVSTYFEKVEEIEKLLESVRMQNELLEIRVRARTNELKTSNETLAYLANTDTMSDLPNRYAFLNKVEELVDSNAPFALCYIDINRFKIINDIHGHEMGDQVLRKLAERFKDIDNEGVFAARMGGDEFGIICQCSESLEDLNNISNKLLERIKLPLKVDQYVFSLDASIGISKYPEDSESKSQLLKYADIAMMQAKHITIGNKIVFYKAHLSEKIERMNQIEMQLRQVTLEEEFELYYQPQIDINTQKLIGAEALLRWRNSELGAVTPAEFIPIAEQTDLILRIGKWVMKGAMEQLAEWNRTADSNLKLGINISPLQFDSIDFFTSLSELIEETGVNPNNLDFEITENSAMNSSTIMEEIFTALSGLGVQISIDDFGTGYSSLSYIKRFDIDRVKIAKELIDNIDADHADRLIIKAIIMIAKGLGLLTIAEGVETYEQLEYLKTVGCDEIQGYYFSKPLTKEVFETRYLNK